MSKTKKNKTEKKLLGMSVGAIAHKLQAIDVQFDLFAKCNLQPTMAERHQFVLTESAKEKIERGEDFDIMDVGNYKLVKRDAPIEIIDRGDGRRSISAFKSYSEAMGGIDVKKGKYNDEERLAIAASAGSSIEVGDVDAWATM